MKNQNSKKIFIYPREFSLHSAHKTLLSHPPKGYSFIHNYSKDSLFKKFKNYSILKKLYKFLVKLTRINLSQKIMISQAVCKDTALILSMGVIHNGSMPQIIDILDNPYSLTGYNYNLFIKTKKTIENKLLSSNCRAIICENESSVELMRLHFSKEVLKKVTLVRPAIVISENLPKKENKKSFQILFMGSIKNPDDFYIKGGLETIRCFDILSKKYPHLRLAIRCAVPPEFKSKVQNNPKICLIEHKLSDKELAKLYSSSDVLSSPSHVYMLMSWLESMSHGLPIIALDTYAARDYLKNGTNGFLIPPPQNLPYSDSSYPTNIRSPKFIAGIKAGDNGVIKQLCLAFEKLIFNKHLRKQIGRNNLLKVANDFSLEKRNQKLKKIFDEALKN